MIVKRECFMLTVAVLVVSVLFPLIIFSAEVPPKVASDGKDLSGGKQINFLGIPLQNLAEEMQLAASKKENILFRTAIFDPIAQGEPDFTAYSFSEDKPEEWDYFVMQFYDLPDEKLKETLYNEGLFFYKYIPNNAYIVSMETKSLEKIRNSHKEIRWIGFLKGGYKVDPKFLTDVFEGSVYIDLTLFLGEDPFSILSQLQEIEKSVKFFRLFHSEIESIMRISIEGSAIPSFVTKASSIKGIEAMDYWTLPHLMNDSSIWVVQTYVSGSTTVWTHGITGTGQTVGVSDSGCDDDMCYFRHLNGVTAVTDSQSPTLPDTGTLYPTRKVKAYYLIPGATIYDESAFSYHGTHVCGSILGDNLATPSTPTSGGHDTADGMAPNAQLVFQDVGESGGSLAGLSNDNYLIFQQAYNAGARIHSNSWGSDTEGAYTSDCKTVDNFIYDHEDFLLYFANGNKSSAGEVGSPASAKNCASIGALTHGSAGADAVASFTSRGPTVDGRYKPDVSAPGVGIVSALGDSSHTSNNCSTQSMEGTSMATPTAAGAGTLLRQYFYDGYYPTGVKVADNAMTPSAALMKASMINGAMDIGTANIPNNDEGYGRVNLENVCYFSGDARKTRVWDKRNVVGLTTGQLDQYQVNVASGKSFKVTLVWTDPEASTIAAVTLINNLDLQVISPSNQVYRGNVFTSGQSVTGGNADSLNNVETFLLNAPEAGVWTIKVIATSVPGTPLVPYSNRQGYALVATYGDCTTSLSAPTSFTATNNGSTGIDLSWGAVSGATEYNIYRADGNCTLTPEKFNFIGKTSSTTYTDTLVQGGFTYAYKVRAVNTCGEGAISTCSTASYTGNCTLYPTFSGLSSAVNNLSTPICDVDLSWSPGSSNCPLGNSIKYNVYRGTNPYFVADSSSRIATGLTATTYKDSSVAPNTTYFYIVRAEDGTTMNGGPANGGNEEFNSVIKMVTPFSSTYSNGTWSDDGGDTNAKLTLTGEWTVTNTLNHTTGGTYCYHNAPDGFTHSPMQCSSATTPSLVLQSGQTPQLSYWVNYNIEYQWDGVVVEISTNGGSTWTAIAPTAGYPSTFSQTGSPPINGCGYSSTQGCFNGPSGNTSLSGWAQYTHDLSSYAGSTVMIRWNFSSDPGAEYQGFYLDDIQITYASINNDCSISNGIVTLDKIIYNCADTISITLNDSDLTGTGSQSVTINSSTESSPEESVTLTESPASSGRFVGTINTTSSLPGYGNGVLSLSNGDTITVTYIDADDGQGGHNVTKTDTATADCIGPVISNVQVTNITASSATITWDTDENANSRVTYGSSKPPSTNQDNLTTYSTSHTIDLSGLTTCTTYYFSVTSSDTFGNSTTDSSSGNYYTFTTQGMAYALTPQTFESGTTGWTLTGQWHQDNCKAHGGSYAMKAGSTTCPGTYNSSTTSDMTTSSSINLGSTGHGYHLRFWEYYQTESGYDYCRPQISTDGTTFTTLGTQYAGTGTTWAQKDIDLSAYTGNVWIRFEFYADSVYNYEGWYVDDVEISKSQGCSAELIYQSKNVTEVCTGTGSGGGNGIVEPGEDATIQITMLNNGMQNATGVSAILSSTTPGVTITDNYATFPDIPSGATGVSQSPHFSIHIDSTVTCVTVANFTLHSTSNENPTGNDSYFTIDIGQAGGAITDFSENFSGVTTPNLPTGWTVSKTSGNDWATNSSGCTGNALYYPYNSTQAANSWAYTPAISLTAGVTYTFSCNQKIYSSSYPEIFEVKCGTGATPAGQTITIITSASYTNTTCTARSNTFTVPTTGNYYIGIHCTSAADMWNLYVDDVLVTHTSTAICNVCTSSCTPPSTPAITSITDKDACSQNGITITFTSGTPATRHDLYKDGAVAQSSVTSPIDYNPLDVNSHSYKIRAINTSDSCYTDSSSLAGTDANNTPTPTISGSSSNVCPSTTTLLATESGMSNYQWYLNGSPISGANSYQYAAGTSGTYTVSYKNGSGCSGTSSGFAVTIITCAPNIVYSTHGTFTEITGNGDTYYDKGEKWSVQVTLQNTGNINATNVTATLSGNGIEVCTPNQSFGNIAVSGTGYADFEFVIDSNFSPCGGSINFNVTNKACTEQTPAGADQNGVFSINVGKPTTGVVTLFGPDDLANLSNWTASNYQAATTDTTCHTAADAQSNLNGTSYLTKTAAVSTVGYTNITVYYDWRVTHNAATQYLDWSTDGTNWNNGVASINTTSWLCNQSTVLPSGANGQSTLYIRFRTVSNNINRRGEVDYIKIDGTQSGYDCSYVGGGTCGGGTPPAEIAVGANYTWPTVNQAQQTMGWNTEATATGYRVYRGTKTQLAALCDGTEDFCTRYDGTNTTLDITSDNPATIDSINKVIYYLIVAYNAGGEGPSGTATCGTRVVNTTGICP